jgi:hypothetical protein
MMRYWQHYFFKMLYQPRTTTRAMLGEKNAIGLGFLYTIGFSFL